MGGFAPGTVEPRSRSRTQLQPRPATQCHTNVRPGTLGPMGNSIPPAVLGRPVSDAETHRDRGHVLRASPPQPSARQAHAGALVGGSVGTGLWGWPPGAPGPAGPTRVGASHVGGSGPGEGQGRSRTPTCRPVERQPWECGPEVRPTCSTCCVSLTARSQLSRRPAEAAQPPAPMPRAARDAPPTHRSCW